MAIPNTTPTPNELYNGEMKKMSDTELRVVLCVTRATLGWEIDPETKMRKQEDWISQKKMMEKTGKSNRAVSTAIESCIKHEWIEARDKEGNLLNTPEKRSGIRAFYRLGRIFLNRLETSEVTSQDSKTSELFSKTSELNDIKPVKIVHTTKETITKEDTISKDIEEPSVLNTEEYNPDSEIEEEPSKKKKSLSPPEEKKVNEAIKLFKLINPMWQSFFSNKTQRGAIKRILKGIGEEKMELILNTLPKTNEMKYAPIITTPCELERNIGKLVAFIQKEKLNGGGIIKV